MHRLANPLRQVSVLLFFALISTSVFGQTTIRERVEIQPKVQQSVFSHSSSSSVLHQVDASKAAVSLPGVTLTVTGVSVNVPSLPFPSNNVAGLYLELRVDASGGGAFPLKRYFVCEGNVTEQGFPLPTLNLSSCGQVYVLYKVISWSGFARCHPRESLYKFALASVGGTGGTFTIQDTVFNAFSAPVPVSATVAVAAGLRPGFEVAQLAVLPGKTTLQCTDNTPVNVTLKNASGQTVTICGGTTLQATASLEGVGPYAFLRQGTMEGQTITFPMTSATSSFDVVLDTVRGVIPLGQQQATLRVTVEGVEGTANINLTCPYPPPAVTITHPAQDTTIVLTQENQPILTLQEEHTPSSGKFEPMISWEPSETITTAEYFEQIQDSLVITVKVRARNIAEMEAVDSVRITLKKNVLDHFAVRVERDTVAFTETSKIFVQGKDARDNDIDPPADTKVNIVLRVDERYGNLAYKSTVGKEVIDVPYSDAKSGQVVFAATGENPIGLEPQKVDVGVTGLGKEGVGSVWVKSNFVKYCQTNSAWANLPYDSYKELDEKGNVKQPERQYTIKDKGCALTAMAMVLKAVGLDYDPKKLNEEMTKDGLFGKHPKTGNWDGGVEWTAVTEYGSAKLKPDPVPIGTQQNWNSKTPIALSSLDSYLRSGAFVIVLVGNPDRRDPTQLRNHWVLVTGNEGGKYKILDPGCYQGRTTLDSYGNVIYRAIIYERK